ncbi:glycosyltransferase family 4 protein [Actibacterium ureilyticum]|uniref:glycosyltransferase family 4 protein n=1 Tax=Actibacterium ureilyticum TaxID=1590614 RepID=UPI0015952B93|nr:glycosyltransferase family 4 protein [Actibacterium ureilyticum]
MTETPKPRIWAPAQADLPPAQTDMSQRIALRFGADYRGANAYQTLLYRAVMGAVDARPATPDDAARELAAAPGQMIYHLHWEEHDMKGAKPAAARRAAQALLDGLDRFADAGGRIVWTRHNARPHDPHCADTHAELVAALTERADVVHCHSWAAVDHLAQVGPVDPAKTVVIAHGNYAGYYPCWPRQQARESFGFAAQDHVFLLFGRLAGYKQLPQTVAHVLQRPDAHVRLLIAGTDPAGVLPTLPDDPRLSLHGGFVADADLGRYFAAADTALLPYTASLSSGLAVMAAGFGLGLLGSDTPGLRDIVRPGQTGLLFDPRAPQGLAAALDHAVALGQAQWRQFGQAASQVAARRDWAGIGRLWGGLFCSLARERTRFDPADARITPV